MLRQYKNLTTGEYMKLSMTEYREHSNSYDGYCTACKDITRYGCTEPDAENYPCEECDENTAMGIEQAMIHGLIQVT